MTQQEIFQNMQEALQEAQLQIEYLHGKFSETGTGNKVLAKIKEALTDAKLPTNG
jgi:hypothetical protein